MGPKIIFPVMLLFLFLDGALVVSPEGQSDEGILAAARNLSAQDISSLTQKAESGDVSAETTLGLAYFVGRQVKQDYAEASKWFRRAAQQGSGFAQCWQGTMYASGRAFPRITRRQ